MGFVGTRKATSIAGGGRSSRQAPPAVAGVAPFPRPVRRAAGRFDPLPVLPRFAFPGLGWRAEARGQPACPAEGAGAVAGSGVAAGSPGNSTNAVALISKVFPAISSAFMASPLSWARCSASAGEISFG